MINLAEKMRLGERLGVVVTRADGTVEPEPPSPVAAKLRQLLESVVARHRERRAKKKP